jgi:aminopeptidase N
MPLMVRFDEGNFLLKEWTFEKSADELLYQLQNDDVIGRGWAARELYKHRDGAEVAKALIDSTRNDEFWAVRQEAIPFLEEAAKMKSYRNVIKRAAESALKNIQFRRGGRHRRP